MKVALITLGCRANQADSMALEDGLRSRGVQLVAADGPADTYVINSCTVTLAADADTRKLARRFKNLQPDARVIVTGCYAQVAAEDLAAMAEVDDVIGNDGKPDLVARILGEAVAPAAPETATGRRTGRDWSPRVHGAAGIGELPDANTRPFVKVQDGCDYSCAFCIIPRARGVSRSLAPDEVLLQALGYAELGARELVLTGIHLGHWGRDLSPRLTFATALTGLADQLQADGRIRRLRLGSLEPNEVTDELIELVAEHPLLCEHLHLPLQSGDDGVLRRMRRLYRRDDFIDTVSRVRARLPDAALGVDVLVGHPGEDAAAFANTRDLLADLPVNYLHVFPFSPRPGTPAAEMTDPVHPAERTLRAAALNRLSGDLQLAFHQRQIGRTLEVLLLKSRQTDGAGWRGLSREFVPVQLSAPPGWDGQRGQLVQATITDAGGQRALAVPAAARTTTADLKEMAHRDCA